MYKTTLTISYLFGLSVMVFVIALFQTSCYKEEFTTSASVKLRFSKDTLRFDTVFTRIGSATKSFKVFNDANAPIRIQNIKIKSGINSVFRLNIDGFSAPLKELSNIEIGSKDSIYIFLEVTIQPNQPLSISPFIIEDEVVFLINNNKQVVYLEAWGQNANYIPGSNSSGTLSLLSCKLQDVVWSDPKPYVIFGVLFIDSCTLRIPAGARVYIHGGIAKSNGSIYNDGIIYTLSQGRLLVEGTPDNRVRILSDRLETELKDAWGAWGGIRIGAGSQGNLIKYADIKSPIVGIYADSASDIRINNTSISNTAGAGILGVHSSIVIENCLIHSNGTHSVQFVYGGNYQIDYCTLANFENDEEALSMNNVFVRDLEKGNISEYPLIASITNTLITGNGKDELDLLDGTTPKKPLYFETKFTNCYINADKLLEPKEVPKFFETFPTCIRAKPTDKVFLNIEKRDFRLDTNSVINNKGKFIDRVLIDFLGIIRNIDQPDIGCFELK